MKKDFDNNQENEVKELDLDHLLNDRPENNNSSNQTNSNLKEKQNKK